jgi:hypothetical protein
MVETGNGNRGSKSSATATGGHLYDVEYMEREMQKSFPRN